MTSFLFTIDDPLDVGTRLDVFLADQEDPPLTRSQVRKYLDAGDILVNDTRVKAGTKLKRGDSISWKYRPPELPDLLPQNIPVPILFEDEHLAIVDKPAGMVVHPSLGHPDSTLVNALLYHFQNLSSIESDSQHPIRPGIVHRIDKDTSGALVIAKSNDAHLYLCDLFRTHDIERIYHALIFDPGLAEEGTFDTLHGRHPSDRFRFSSRVPRGKHAITHYRILERFPHQAALVACKLETGRTHQIRVHFADAQAPLLGDTLYGGRVASQISLISRQALHARTLGFVHPNGDDVHTLSPYPEDFERALETLRAGRNWR